MASEEFQQSVLKTYLCTRKCIRSKEFYRANEMALWFNLIPKFDQIDQDGGNVSHDLEMSENRTTYEEPKRLLDDFYRHFPHSPIPPVPPLYWKECPPEPEEEEEETTTASDESTAEYDMETTQSTKYDEEKSKPDADSSANSSDDDSSPVPLSIVVAVGCALIFLNLLICVGMYYQRKRLRKLRERPVTGNGNDVSDNRNNDRSISRDTIQPDGTTVVHPQDNNLPKVANMNHKAVSDGAPVYSTIAKPASAPQGPGGYTYSALSQKSPMHSHQNHIHFADQVSQKGPPSEDGSQSSSSKGHYSTAERPAPGANQVPKDTRVKHIPRGTHQVSSNNAITIV